MNYNPPAASPYSPPTRALILRTTKSNHGHKKSLKIIVLYLILKFWDKPFLQKLLKKAVSQWTSACNENQLLNQVVQSRAGIFAGQAGKKATYYLARCLINAIQFTRAEQVGVLTVPNSIRDWAAEYEYAGVENNTCSRTLLNVANGKDCTVEITLQNHINTDRAIDRVLKYWFGQYNPEKSQKQLWMIASSSKEHLKKIDAEITKSFGQLLMELSQQSEMRETWCSNHGWRGYVASIIVLDQMSRHIHRHYRTIGKTSASIPSVEQKVVDNYSHCIAQEFQQNYAEELACGMIPLPMMIFSLMPLRHKSTLQSVGFVQSQVESIASLHSIDMENMTRRFRRATNRRMAVLQDEARRDGKATVYKNINVEEDEDEDEDDSRMNGPKRTKFEENDILDFHHFEADMSTAKNAVIAKTMVQFLAARGIRPCKSSSDNVAKNTPVIVSLSGGVDSMVIAGILAHLRDECGFAQLYIAAVHIDYGNRPESAEEAAYVKHYALNILHLDRCIVRVINEVTRGVTKRDEYEKFSRNIRYEIYRETVAECIKVCSEKSPSRQILEVGVMLGHHRGDVVENVISNSNKGSGPLDLSGMTSISKNDGVAIYRPLLPLEKVDVFDYSHKYGVPYFKDTTPHWSTRGKLRNKLIPLLMEVYGDGCLKNLASLAEESDEARALFNESALKPFMEKVERFPMGIIFSTGDFAHQGSYFWKIVLKNLLHSVGLGMFSEKSVQSFLKRILPKKITSGTLNEI